MRYRRRGLVLVLIVVWPAANAMAEEPFRRPADRQTLRQPELRLELRDTDDDHRAYDKDMQPYAIDSHATSDYSADTGTYSFTWEEPDNPVLQHAEWTPAWQIDVRVSASAARSDDNSLYRYSYSVDAHARPGSTLYWFKLLYPAHAEELGTERPEYKGYLLPPDNKFRAGFPEQASWFYRGDVYPELSEEMTAGFWLVSASPPTIVTCFASSTAPLFRADSEPPSSIEMAVTCYRGPCDEQCYGVTIGPGYTTTSIEQVRGYLPVCLQQSWISGYRYVRNLDIPLGKAQRLRDAGNVPGMVSALEETVNKLDEIRSYKRRTYEVTDEAYALIRYNCEHLIRQASAKKE